VHRATTNNIAHDYVVPKVSYRGSIAHPVGSPSGVLFKNKNTKSKAEAKPTKTTQIKAKLPVDGISVAYRRRDLHRASFKSNTGVITDNIARF